MKYNYLLLCFIGLIFSCSKTTQKNGFSIEGKISNCPRNEIFLFEYYAGKIRKIDSTKIENGQFVFKGSQPLPRGFYRIGFNYRFYTDLILCNEQIGINLDYNNMNESAQIQNSKENELFMNFKKNKKEIEIQLRSVKERASNITLEGNTESKNIISELQKEYENLREKEFTIYREIMKNNPDTYMATLAQLALVPKLQDFPQYQTQYVREEDFLRDHYFDGIDFSNPELLRGPMLEEKIFVYFQNFIEKSAESYQKAVDMVIEKACKTDLTCIATLEYLLSLFKNYNPPDIYNSIAWKYIEKAPNGDLRAEIDERIETNKKFSPGSVAVDLTLKDPLEKPMRLSSLKGKIVLLDFWASWCRPCRVENPNIVRLFNKYKDKGFTIYSVSLDTDKNKWLAAIKDDNLTWNHVSDLKGWQSEAAAIYSVTSIPHTFLIDREGRIIAKNLRGDDLERKLEELFK